LKIIGALVVTGAVYRLFGLRNSTHISARFRTKGAGYAKLSAVVIHYVGATDED
jgi:hypothetical protein